MLACLQHEDEAERAHWKRTCAEALECSGGLLPRAAEWLDKNVVRIKRVRALERAAIQVQRHFRACSIHRKVKDYKHSRLRATTRSDFMDSLSLVKFGLLFRLSAESSAPFSLVFAGSRLDGGVCGRGCSGRNCKWRYSELKREPCTRLLLKFSEWSGVDRDAHGWSASKWQLAHCSGWRADDRPASVWRWRRWLESVRKPLD